MNTIPELIEASHAMAVEKGWWDGGTRSVVDQVNNFHSEISEAWEEYRHGRMETWYSAGRIFPDSSARCVEAGWKPEGFWVEMADLCIRLADTMGAYGWRFSSLRQSDVKKIADSEWDFGILIATLHICVGCIGIDDNGDIGLGFERGAERSASGTIDICFRAAEHHGIDLWPIIREKMSYNATRPVRHGGLKA
jgi:hypothetical protein